MTYADGETVSLDAKTYLVNHTDRNLGAPLLTSEQKDEAAKILESLNIDLKARGEGRAVARVSVELDFDDTTTDTQTFTPVVDDSGIIRSQQDSNETYNGTATNPGGPAGVQSNVPGYVAKEVKGNERSIIKVIHSTAKTNADAELGKFIGMGQLCGYLLQTW